jgi:tetratricopeptide (TPR) repeat protein
MGRAGRSNNITGRQPGSRRKGARVFFCRLILGGSCCLGAVWVACLVVTTPEVMASSPPISPLVEVEKAPTHAKDDLEQLQRFEGFIGDGKFHEVEPLLKSYLKAHPDSARAYYDLGYSLFRTHQISASVGALAKSLQLDINNAEAHKILGLNLTMVGKYEEAQIEMEQAAHLKPDSAEIHYFLGRIHYTRNAFPLAKQEFEQAIRLDPSYMKAYNNLGLTMEGMGDDKAALANYEKAFQLMKRQGLKSEWPYINVCAMYNRLDRPEQALEYCQKAIVLNPKSDQAFFETARAHMAQKNWDAAAKALERAIEINPRFAKFHYVLSTVYRKAGKPAESEREMAAYRKLFEQSGAQRPPETPERPHPEADNPAEVRH